MKQASLIVLTLLLLMIVGGCNIFSWTSSDSFDNLMDEGNELMRDGDYSGAAEKFAQALEEEPQSSDALYFHAKASLYAAGFNALTLTTTMTNTDYNTGEYFPFTDPTWQADNKKLSADLYGAVLIVYNNLNPIFYNHTHGSFDSTDIDLDYAISAGILGMLLFQDTNLDGVIDENDFDLSIVFNENLGTFTIDNMNEYANSITPAQRDQFFNNIDTYITESGNIVLDILQSNTNEQTEEGSVDPIDVDAVLDDIREMLVTYN